eukprot:6430830-Heterocapsa_arctica.AAC.1
MVAAWVERSPGGVTVGLPLRQRDLVFPFGDSPIQPVQQTDNFIGLLNEPMFGSGSLTNPATLWTRLLFQGKWGVNKR